MKLQHSWREQLHIQWMKAHSSLCGGVWVSWGELPQDKRYIALVSQELKLIKLQDHRLT